MSRSDPHLLALAIGLLVGTVSCQSGDVEANASPIEFRDSAGVTIVENPAPVGDPRLPWSLSAEPQADIGTLDGPAPLQLFRALHSTRHRDGRILVVNSGSQEIRSFDAQGNHLASWGGDGEGPGEYRLPLRVASWTGDSVAVWDTRLRRVTILSGDGTLGRTVDLGGEDLSGLVQLADPLPGGRLVLVHQDIMAVAPSNGVHRNPTIASVLDATGEIQSSLPEQPGDEIFMMLGDGSIDVLRFAFAKSFVARAQGDRILFGPNDTFDLRLYTDAGELERIVRLGTPPRVVTDADWEAEIDRRVEGAAEERRPGLRTLYAEIPKPDALPAFADALVDPLGHIWANVFRPPVEPGPAVWAVFDPEGRFLGYVETPEGLILHQVGPDYILGHSTDDLDVEHIQLWGLDRGPDA
ncbi:MAG: hypothetical protein ACR2QM_02985 [Longimicrobiales bacterium]